MGLRVYVGICPYMGRTLHGNLLPSLAQVPCAKQELES